MEINYIDLPVLRENDKSYFLLLEGIINSIDQYAILEVRRNLNNFSFRIVTSAPEYINPLVKELNNLHNLCNIKVDFSKSMKTSSALSYKINLES